MKLSKIIVSGVGILIGIIIIIVGFNVQSISGTYISEYTVGEPIEFGADFYTEMYNVTKDVGNAVNNAANDLGSAIANACGYICNAVGWLIVVIGLIDICVFGYKLFGAVEAMLSNNRSNHNNNTYSSSYAYASYNTAHNNNVGNTSYNTAAQPAYSAPAQESDVKKVVVPQPQREEKINTVEDTPKDMRSKDVKWMDAESKYGAVFGKCENCGSKKEKLIFAECTDFFGSTRKNICYDCFCKKESKPIPRI